MRNHANPESSGLLHWGVVGAIVAAGWPVILWYERRLLDRSDEPLGVLALVAAALAVGRTGLTFDVSRNRLRLCFFALLGYVVATAFAPPLFRALFWVLGLGAAIAPKRASLAWTGLLLLSLPWVASLQFYLGYPLRWSATRLAAGALGLLGWHVKADAVTLLWAGERVLIDAPCAGLHLGWILAFLALGFCVWAGADARRTWRLVRQAGLIAFAANVVRIVALFLLETRHGVSGHWLHETTGLLVSATAAAGLSALGLRLSPTGSLAR